LQGIQTPKLKQLNRCGGDKQLSSNSSLLLLHNCQVNDDNLRLSNIESWEGDFTELSIITATESVSDRIGAKLESEVIQTGTQLG
jgi:hypothetical protein